jgi:hypothetical protein
MRIEVEKWFDLGSWIQFYKRQETLTYMNSTIIVSRLNKFVSCLSINALWAISVLVLVFFGTASVSGQTDDFDDGNDDGWVRFNPMQVVGAGASWTFPDGGYRLQAPRPAVGAAGPARAFSYHAVEYSEFFAAVDIVAWNNEVNQAFGILGRASHIGLGETTGYVLNYNPNQTGGQPGGQFQINRVTNEAENGTLATANITLIPTGKYRMVFVGSGSVLSGYLYDLEDLTFPLATIAVSAEDDDRAGSYAAGYSGLFVFSRGIATADTSIADATFDNYAAMGTPPAQPELPGTAPGIAGRPQVVQRSPRSNANFHAASEGINFTAATFTDEAVQTVEMILNGKDVSGQLTIVGEPNARVVSYDGLHPNTVYQGQITLATATGQTLVNRWNFDTFAADYFESAEAKVIEAEDYNFNGGQYINNPPPSGVAADGNFVNWGQGYYDQIGTPEVDFFDFATAPHEVGISYRPEDVVATRPGSNDVNPGGRVNDTPRQKYVSAGVPDFQVWRTEAGEWLNYTRQFVSGDYNVYLRVASRAAQEVHLDQVTSSRTGPNQTTAPLGVFSVPNTMSPQIYQYVPLTDANGKLKPVSLAGEQTLRLTMGGEPEQFSTRFTLFLNYMVLVPAVAETEQVLVVESSAAVDSGYAPELSALIDSQAGTISIPLPAETRFYRLRNSEGPGRPQINNARVSGGNILMNYNSGQP